MIEIKARITQGMLEDFERNFRELKTSEREGRAEDRGRVARAAAKAGWFIDEVDITGADPRDIFDAAERVMDTYISLVEMPPHTSGGGELRQEETTLATS